MALPPTQSGKIITFYSYKGGTGRSMAVANIACLLARRLARTAQRILVMDWDLEAPGLHRFFAAKSELPEYDKQPGVMNYFCSLRELLAASPKLYDDLSAPEGWRVLDQKLPLDDYIIPDVVLGVDFVPAGRFDIEYPRLVNSFSWIEFFERYGTIVRAFRELLAMKFAYTLVDSRTGLTDVSGICTTLLPEKLVGVFTPNRQSLYGLRDVIVQAIEYRSRSDDFRPLSVFPLPSRVENAEKDLREQWRREYQDQFESLFRRLHETEQCDLTAYFDVALLPHVSYYAYGENIAVLQERSDAISLSAAYQRFFERMIDSDYAWQIQSAEKTEPTLLLSPHNEKPKQYHAFLSYDPSDEKLVSDVDLQLQNYGISSFFALRDLLPGENWALRHAAAMAESQAIVVFVGPNGRGPWQDQESLVALENCAKDTSKRIIPVLLPKAPRSDKLRLPNFLRTIQWVDLRGGLSDEKGMENLVWGLTGERPKLKQEKHSLRLTFATVTIALAVLTGFVVFLTLFLGNMALKSEVRTATEVLHNVRATPNQVPTIDQLRKLDRVRQELENLSTYSHGSTLERLRWWLYSGDDLYSATRQVYFDRFSDLLFAETQAKLLNALLNVKEKPDLNDNYETTYNMLKAYLITTSNPEKSTKDFLTPVLYTTWSNGKTVDDQTATLARAQFDFYGRELLVGNPYGSSQDPAAIGRTRSYLGNFGGIDRYYLPLKADISRKVPGASFSKQFRDATDTIASPHDVEGPFTPDGFTRMQDAIAHNRIVNEEWVLGKAVTIQLDQTILQQQLSERYYGDFIKEWRTVLQTSAVRAFGSFHDADIKLGKLSSPSSPLLELFWFVSHNTNVQLQQITDSFQPVQSVVPAGPPDQYILASNQQYVAALNKLKSQISLLAASPTGTADTGLVTQALSAAGDANGSVSQMTQKFRVDPQFHIENVTQNLLLQPINHAQDLIKTGPKEALNGGARNLCSQFTQITGRFPFNPSSSQDASLDQLNQILAPKTGALWAFYDSKLAQFMSKQGSTYVANPMGAVKITPEFVGFFNRAASLSDALYSGGSPTPHVTYSLKQESTNIDGLALTIGNGSIVDIGQIQTFTWTSASEAIVITAKGFPIGTYAPGSWAAFHFIYDGHPTRKGVGTYDLNFVYKGSNGQDIVVKGQKQFFSYQLQFTGPNPLAAFSGLGCVSVVTR